MRILQPLFHKCSPEYKKSRIKKRRRRCSSRWRPAVLGAVVQHLPNTRVQQLPNAGVQQLPESLGGGWGRGRPTERLRRRAGQGAAGAGAVAVKFGQTRFGGDFLGNRCIVFIFAGSSFFRVPSKHVFAGNRCR
jgi:hypothetical protein